MPRRGASGPTRVPRARGPPRSPGSPTPPGAGSSDLPAPGTRSPSPPLAAPDSHQEGVARGFGRRIRAFVLDRVLGAEHGKGTVEPISSALDRHLPFLHRFQQRRLRLWWSAVDLVSEEEVRKDRAGTELE